MRRLLPTILFCLFLFLPEQALHAAAHDQAGSALLSRPAQKQRPAAVLREFLGIPYRNDGVLNDEQQYATFNDPHAVSATPGLNCSGMVLAASRRILGKNIALKDAVRDRSGDSGPGSPAGRDWDFGFDLVMNIAEGTKHELLLPPGEVMPAVLTGRNVPGFNPHAPAFADALLPRIKENRLYLVSFSRRKTPEAPAHLHYHTAIFVREGETVWAYGTTRNSRKVIRLNLTSPDGLASFRRSFRDVAGSYKRLTVIEIVPE